MRNNKFSPASQARRALAASVFAAVCTAHAATDYQYIARTEEKVAAEQGAVKAGSLSWKCAGNECRISGPWATPGLGACKALAQKVGRLASYGHSGHWLSSKELEACNAGVEVSLPSPGVAKNVTSQAREDKLTTGAIQAPSGQLKGAQPSASPAQAPLENLNGAAVGPIDLPTPVTLSQTELDAMAFALNSSGSQRYLHLVLAGGSDKEGRMRLRAVSADSFDGVLLLRDTSALEGLRRRLYFDQLGNLVMDVYLVGRGAKRYRSTITLTPDNQTLVSIGLGTGGMIDVVLSSGKDGRMRMTGPEGNVRRLRECMEMVGLPADSDKVIAASLCASCLDSEMEVGSALTAEEISCVKERADRSVGPTGRMPGIFGTNPEDIDAMCKDILSSPRRGGPLRGRTADGTHNDLVSVDRLTGKTFWERRTEELLDLLEALADTVGPTIIWTDDMEDSTDPRGPEADPEVDPNELPGAGAALYEFCENRAKSRSSGTYCYDLECARKRADSISAISGGKCWQEPSPAGGEHTVCRREEDSQDNERAGDPGAGPGDSGSTDDPRTDRLGRSSGAGGRYIDTTPMGGFLAGLCAKGGCPDPQPMDTGR